MWKMYDLCMSNPNAFCFVYILSIFGAIQLGAWIAKSICFLIDKEEKRKKSKDV